jgi:hypothetical protein
MTLSSMERTMKTPVTLSIFLTGLLLAPALQAQTTPPFPTKPIRMMIGFAPGGPSDILGRVVAPKLSELLGQAVVIENRGGAGGTIGMEMTAKAPADGYNLNLGSSGNMIMAPHLYPKISYNMQKDLVAVGQMALTAYVIAVNPSVPVKTVPQLVKLANTKKNLMSYGSSGSGATSHITAELFRMAIGAEMVHVPYKGTGPSLTAVVSGEIDMMFADLIPALPHAQNGRLRLLATLGSKRPAAAMDLPTANEAGVQMPPVVGRYGVVAPAGTPREIIIKLNNAIIAALKAPDMQQRVAQIGFEVQTDTPEQFAAVLKSENEIYGPVIKKAGIKID